jgi:hypothetical protein
MGNRRKISADDVAQHYQKKMPEDVGGLFGDLFQQVAALHEIWRSHDDFFSISEQRFASIRESGPGFFRVVKVVLFDATVLGIARLTRSSPIAQGRYSI